mgnify:CR=1 FL=1
MNFTEIKNRQLIYFLLIILGLLILLFVFIFPIFGKINKIKNEIMLEKKSLNSRLELDENSKQIIKNLEQAETDLSKLESIYIKEGNELELINFIEGIAQDNNLEIKISPDFNIPRLGLEPIKIKVDISARGDFINIFNFIQALDTAPFYLISDRLSLQKNQSNLILTINGHVYLKK